MSKHKKYKKTKKANLEESQENTTPVQPTLPRQKAAKSTKKLATRILEWVLGILTLLGGVSTVVTFLPRVSIVQADPSDPTNPFSATFTITNASSIPVPLHQVSVRLCPGGITGAGVGVPNEYHYGFNCPPIFVPSWQNHTLKVDERFTITLEGVIGMQGRGTPHAAKLGGADIFIIVTYTPWLLPWHREVGFRFRTRDHGNGTFSWEALPND